MMVFTVCMACCIMQGKPSAQLAPSLCAAAQLPVFSISTAPAGSTEQQAPLPARLFDEGLSLAILEACNFAGKAVCTLLRYVLSSMLPPLLVSILAALSLSVCRLPVVQVRQQQLQLRKQTLLCPERCATVR